MDTSSVSLSVFKTASEGEVLQIKLGASFGELNVYASPSERSSVRLIRDARWESRGSVRLGSVFGTPAWWSVEGDQLTILVGPDDETWDLGVTFPATVLDELEQQWAAA